MPTTLSGPCAACGGTKRAAQVLFAVDLGTGVLIVRHVPALVCSQCGERWFTDDVTRRLEELASDARRRGADFEVVTLSDAA
jgi:YgiT-type zinc finger domain-containing protein